MPLLSRGGDDPIDTCDDGGAARPPPRRRPGRTAEGGPGRAAAKRYTGEQSNTSIFYGSELLAKVFRRLEPGVNTDVEVHRALAGSGVVAELYGAWRVDGTDYAVFLEALKDPQDGYVLACDHAREARSFAGHAHALGESLATVHRLLADEFPTSTIDGASLVTGFQNASPPSARCHRRHTAMPPRRCFAGWRERPPAAVAATAISGRCCSPGVAGRGLRG